MEQRLRNSWLMTCCMLFMGPRDTSCLGGRPSVALCSRMPLIVCASISASLMGFAPLDTLRQASTIQCARSNDRSHAQALHASIHCRPLRTVREQPRQGKDAENRTTALEGAFYLLRSRLRTWMKSDAEIMPTTATASESQSGAEATPCSCNA